MKSYFYSHLIGLFLCFLVSTFAKMALADNRGNVDPLPLQQCPKDSKNVSDLKKGFRCTTDAGYIFILDRDPKTKNNSWIDPSVIRWDLSSIKTYSTRSGGEPDGTLSIFSASCPP